MKKRLPLGFWKVFILGTLLIILAPPLLTNFYYWSLEDEPTEPGGLLDPAEQELVFEGQRFTGIPPLGHDLLFINCSFVNARFGYSQDMVFLNCSFVDSRIGYSRDVGFLNCSFREVHFYFVENLFFRNIKAMHGGFGLSFTDSSEIFLTGLLFRNNGYALSFKDCSEITVEDGSFQGNGRALWISSCENVFVRDSHFQENDEAVWVWQSRYSLEGNTFQENENDRLIDPKDEGIAFFFQDPALICILVWSWFLLHSGVYLIKQQQKRKKHLILPAQRVNPYIRYPPKARKLYPWPYQEPPAPGRPVKHLWKQEDEQ